MKISKIVELLDAQVRCGADALAQEVSGGCACDMMSDVLASERDVQVLLTGLVNPQVMRTAEMLDIVCVIFCRGKEPTEAMLELAEERSLVVLTTKRRMFSASGILYQAGL